LFQYRIWVFMVMAIRVKKVVGVFVRFSCAASIQSNSRIYIQAAAATPSLLTKQ
jgi:hypothetical protein